MSPQLHPTHTTLVLAECVGECLPLHSTPTPVNSGWLLFRTAAWKALASMPGTRLWLLAMVSMSPPCPQRPGQESNSLPFGHSDPGKRGWGLGVSECTCPLQGAVPMMNSTVTSSSAYCLTQFVTVLPTVLTGVMRPTVAPRSWVRRAGTVVVFFRQCIQVQTRARLGFRTSPIILLA